jgi:hypothetical protein
MGVVTKVQAYKRVFIARLFLQMELQVRVTCVYDELHQLREAFKVPITLQLWKLNLHIQYEQLLAILSPLRLEEMKHG